MRILREIGIEFLNPEAVAHLKAAGCTVNGTNVRMDEDFRDGNGAPRTTAVHHHAAKPGS